MALHFSSRPPSRLALSQVLGRPADFVYDPSPNPNLFTIQNCTFGDCSFWGNLLTYPAEAKKAAESLLFFSKTGSVSILNNVLENGASYLFLDRWEGTKPSPYVLSGNSWQ